jgi:hypothetical protein
MKNLKIQMYTVPTVWPTAQNAETPVMSLTILGTSAYVARGGGIALPFTPVYGQLPARPPKHAKPRWLAKSASPNDEFQNNINIGLMTKIFKLRICHI